MKKMSVFKTRTPTFFSWKSRSELFTLSQKRELMANVWLKIQNFELKAKSLIFYVKSSKVYMYKYNYYHNIKKRV
jgi:hypothetical protein